MNNFRFIIDATKIIGKEKQLWLFGFLAALTLEGPAGYVITLGNGWWYQDQGMYALNIGTQNTILHETAWFIQNIDVFLFAGGWMDSSDMIGRERDGVFITLLAISAFLFWLFGLIARSSLIHEVSALDDDGREVEIMGRAGALFSVGFKFLPRILFLQLLVWLPIILLETAAFLLNHSLWESILSTVVWERDFNYTQQLREFLLIVNNVSLGLILPLLIIDGFAFRAIVVDDLPVITGINWAIETIKDNLWQVLVLLFFVGIFGIILAFVGDLLVGAVWYLIVLMISSPSVSVCFQYPLDFGSIATCMAGSEPALIYLPLLRSALFAVVFTPWVLFQSAVFTLAYRRFTEIDEDEDELLPEPA